MIRHVFALAWQRKRANALLILVLLLTFLVLFGLAGFGLHLLRLYRVPLGFEYADTWAVNVATGGEWSEARDRPTLQQVLAAVERLNDVESVYISGALPFLPGNGGIVRWQQDGARYFAIVDSASDGMLEALGTRLIEGRWFGPQDESSAFVPAVVNRNYRDMASGTTVLGMEFELLQPTRIVGIIDDFRLDGEFSPQSPVIIFRSNTGSTNFSLTLLLKPGVAAAFEEDLLDIATGIAPQWEFTVRSWASLRASHIREYTLPLLIGGIVAGFMLLLVGCGLLGVLWQNVIRRMAEMGLRRAVGASAGAVRFQIMLELIAMACMALVIGFAAVVQLPLSGKLPALDWELFILTELTSTLALLGLCTLFVLYPSYQATSRAPVDALRCN